MDPSWDATWVTESAASKTATLSHRQCRLVALGGEGEFSLSGQRTRIGSRAPSDVILDDRKVSGLHFEIERSSRGYIVRDLNSRNGTFIGETRILEALISGGTIIRAGDSQLRFEVLSEHVSTPISLERSFGRLVGGSGVMRDVFWRARKVAESDATVLIQGETGTGKDLLAEAIHSESARCGGPFAILDCGAISGSLAESELFGHERGAFTGATHSHKGVFERGSGGTVFLDEIGELPLELQPALLRALENRRVRRVGGTRDVSFDIRIVAATNRDLALEVERGRFREDLYFRLAVVELHVPPLRERKEDIELLIEAIQNSSGAGKAFRVDRQNVEHLQRYDWPGNVRELRNVVERASLFSDVQPALGHLFARKAESGEEPRQVGCDVRIDTPFKVAKRAIVDDFERAYVAQLLETHGGNISACARQAGVDRMVIHKIAERHGLRGNR